MTKTTKLWRVKGITHPDHPGITVRVGVCTCLAEAHPA